MIDGLRLAPKGTVTVEVSMMVDESGLLQVTAKEVGGDREAKLNVEQMGTTTEPQRKEMGELLDCFLHTLKAGGNRPQSSIDSTSTPAAGSSITLPGRSQSKRKHDAHPDQPLKRACIRPCSITQADVDAVKNGDKLNDEAINIYLESLGQLPRGSEAKRVHTFNSFFCNKINAWKANDPSTMKGWMPEDLFSFDYMMVPVHESDHWWMAIICNDPVTDGVKPIRIMVLDSVDRKHTDFVERLQGFLEGIAEHKQIQVRISQTRVRHIPQQQNSVDCGVFVLHYAKKFILDPDHSIEYLTSTEGSSGNWSFEPQDMREEAAREMSKVLSTATSSLPAPDTLATTHP